MENKTERKERVGGDKEMLCEGRGRGRREEMRRDGGRDRSTEQERENR